MMNIKKGKKADMNGFYWILIMIIVSFFVAVCVMMINGAPVDVRGVEADILFNRVVDCVMERGYVIPELSTQENADSFDIEKRCKLNFNEFNSLTKQIDKGQYYVSVNITDLDRKRLISYQTKDGRIIASFYCAKEEQEGEGVGNWPRCTTRQIYGLMRTGTGDKEVILDVRTGVNKGEKNVK